MMLFIFLTPFPSYIQHREQFFNFARSIPIDPVNFSYRRCLSLCKPTFQRHEIKHFLNLSPLPQVTVWQPPLQDAFNGVFRIRILD